MSEPGPLWRRLGAIFTQPGLTPDERLLLVLLEWFAKNGTAWPGFPTMAQLTGLGERTVYRLIARLEHDLELLEVDHGGGRRRPNHYEVTLPVWQGFGRNGTGETLPAATETLPAATQNPATVAGERSRERSKELSTPTAPSKSLENDGADEARASGSATRPNGNAGLTRISPADFEAYKQARRAETGAG